MARRGEMQEVELLDGVDDGAGHEPGVGPHPGATARTRVRRRWLIGGAAALAVTLGVAQWVVTARESATLARLAHVPGVLSPVDETLDIVRRVPAADVAELFGVAGAGLERAEDGSQSFTWVDPAGGPGWTTELLGPNAALAGAHHVFGGTSCPTDNAPATDIGTAHRVVCLVTDGGTPLEDGGTHEAVPASSRQVVVLSTKDGAVEARWPLERGQAIALLPPDIVVVGSMAADSGEVTAYDLLTGDERWTHEAHLMTATGYAEGGMGMSLFRAGDLVAYSTPEGRLTLLSAAGDVVRDDLGYQGDVGGSWMIDPATGTLVVQSHTRDGKAHSTVLAVDGDPAGDLTVDGQLVYASVDDGSVPGLMLSYDTALHGWDSGTRTARWSHDAYQTTSAVILRGTVYAATARGIIALDGATGAPLWSREGNNTLIPGTLFTDGRHILLAPDTS
ncbi:MAG TPA: PQQ-binding-like beta-propeller repeat protein, partial [Cellulomonas sp.]|uniref:outer membrane protein assembly factor BamB family protein n=1 Tax=Cellulomonas sp. TaxID=40001 RepID=UPI002E2FA084